MIVRENIPVSNCANAANASGDRVALKTNMSRDQAVMLLTTSPTSPAVRLSPSARERFGSTRRDRFCSCYLVGAATAEAAMTKRATLENILIWKVWA